jgi:hypothetical protein
MADNIYMQISKKVGRDVRLVRKVTHHPFDFLSRQMADVNNHKHIRLRYLGVFATKDYWRKGMTRSSEGGFPPEGIEVYARVPEVKFNREYINLKQGIVKDSGFISSDGNVECDLALVEWWRPLIVTN